MKGRTRPAKATTSNDYEPTDKEIDAARRMIARRKEVPTSPRYKVRHSDGKPVIEANHPDKSVTHTLLADLFATGDSTLAEGLLVHLANVAQGEDELTGPDLNVMVATVKAIAPRDPTEALLACQMAAIHKATIFAARRFNRAEMLPQYEAAGNQLNKLARTFAAQMEALKRYRSTGEQNIRVQHVTVNEGGQAIVGDVRSGGGGTTKNASQSHAIGKTDPAGPVDASGPALLSHQQAVGLPLPGAGGEGKERVSNARRTGRGTEGQG